ncbi:phosphatidylserine decarboxylase [Nocardia sp. BMG111209]|uniref:phosphatidylserine decarboxylase n=1 Tax=Nocardia sp. BMG111209 TaxID=1160137 RepID=UPI00036B42FB|nr:phosphatidylserine decarboxylase [Nocardia sp. BMG111209]
MIAQQRRVIAWAVAASVFGSGSLYVFWRTRFFFRDPPRRPPADPTAIVAPADGVVTYVKRIDGGEIPEAVKNGRTIPLTEFTGVGTVSDGYLIGIYMTEYSVHRNRAPIAGTICLRRHRAAAPFNRSMARIGANVIAGRTPYDEGCDYLLTNERLTIGIRHTSGAVVLVTQIADLWVNRIVARVREGDDVTRAQQYGMIRFGSQCDAFLPDELVTEIAVHPGQYVFAGKTALATSTVSVAGDRSEDEAS